MPDRRTAFQATWERFTRISETVDSLADERVGDRRWRWRLPDIAFIIPIDDEDVIAQCVQWQQALRAFFDYHPQPPERLHITLHYVGDLRRNWWEWRRTTWSRASLPQLAERVRWVFASLQPFTVEIGPLSAFPTALFAEVHDGNQLDRMRDALIAALPRRASLLFADREYLPHVTLGYWGLQAVPDVVNALEAYRQAPPVSYRVERVKFTTYIRDSVPLQPDILARAREEILTEYKLTGA